MKASSAAPKTAGRQQSQAQAHSHSHNQSWSLSQAQAQAQVYYSSWQTCWRRKHVIDVGVGIWGILSRARRRRFDTRRIILNNKAPIPSTYTLPHTGTLSPTLAHPNPHEQKVEQATSERTFSSSTMRMQRELGNCVG